MKKLIAVLLLLCTTLAQAQSKKIDKFIEAMNNSEFVIDHSKKSTFTVDSKAAHKLIKIGRSANVKLIEALKDSSRNIIAHYVLCQINDKTVTFAGPKTIRKDKEELNIYYLGEEKGEGVLIYESKVKNDYKIYFDRPMIDKITIYWQKKTGGK